jgi:bifunctional NMN adenylyltransferase/nudix hydrolase
LIYDYVIYLGRFQPFHEGHQATLKQALARGKKVIVGVGSANRSRSTENPFEYSERFQMICNTLSPLELDRTEILPIYDFPYNDSAWMLHVNNTIGDYVFDMTGKSAGELNIAIIGFKKDDTSRYLEWFPNWTYIGVEEQHGIMSATDIRNLYFQKGTIISEFLPDTVRKWLKSFTLNPAYKWLLNEFEYIREYPKLWGKGPFITVDAVVEQMGHILLVTRKEAPFKGKLAIPGGFVNLNELIAKARIRELKEETRLSDSQGEIPPAKIASFMVKEKVYDDPKRSQRGRVITFAGLYKLPPAKELYKVIGSDDAEKAAWYNLSDLDASMFMEDHYFIIQDMLGVTEGV